MSQNKDNYFSIEKKKEKIFQNIQILATVSYKKCFIQTIEIVQT